MFKKWRSRWRLGALLPLMIWLMTGCSQENLSTLIPAGPVAREQLWLMKFSLGVMLIVFVVVIAVFFYVLVKYRKRKGQTGIPEQVEGNHTLEIIWTVIPFIMLFVLAIPTIMYTFKFEKVYSASEAIQVKVTGHQFWWEFEYPQYGFTTGQDLYIPKGKQIQFELTSKDVIHSFWVPAIGGKRDNNPGLINKMTLLAEKEGVFKGKCAELCGPSHALMDFKVIVLDENDFNTWSQKMRAKPEPMDLSPLAAKGKELFTKNSCISCHAVGGNGGVLGPNLTNFADREMVASIRKNTTENVKAWIKDPNSIKPGNTMFKGYSPYPNFSDDDLDALAAYLESLHVYKK